MAITQLIKSWNIYKMTSPADRVYVGLTSDVVKRKSNYRRTLDCSSQPMISNSIIKYGFDSHNFEVIDTFQGNLSEAFSKEMFWIRTYMSNYCKYPEMRGLNLTNGGKGASGNVASREKRKRMSEARKRVATTRVWTTEQKLAMSECRKGAKHTQESKNKIGIASKGNKFNLGRKSSQETKNKISANLKGNKYNLGRKQSQEEKDKRAVKIILSHTDAWKLSHSKKITEVIGKPILQYDINNNVIKEYISASSAERELNLKKCYIKYFLKSGTLSIKTKSYFKYKI